MIQGKFTVLFLALTLSTCSSNSAPSKAELEKEITATVNAVIAKFEPINAECLTGLSADPRTIKSNFKNFFDSCSGSDLSIINNALICSNNAGCEKPVSEALELKYTNCFADTGFNSISDSCAKALGI